MAWLWRPLILNPHPGPGAQGHAALCMRQDGEGHKGVFLDHVGTKNTAAKTIAIALRSLGPHVLSWGEMVREGCAAGLPYLTQPTPEPHKRATPHAALVCLQSCCSHS